MTTMTSPPRPETGQAPTRSEASKTKLTRRQRLSRLDVKASPYLYIAPFFVLFALIGLFPLVYTFVVSLNDWDILSGAGEWIGFENYVAELNDPYFWNSLFNTMSIFLLSAIPQLVAAVFIAAVLDQNLRAKTFWRMSILIPYIVTPVAVAIIFSSAFGEKYGLINNILTSFNIEPVMWKSEATSQSPRWSTGAGPATTRSSSSPPCRRCLATSTNRQPWMERAPCVAFSR